MNPKPDPFLHWPEIIILLILSIGILCGVSGLYLEPNPVNNTDSSQ